VVCVICLGIWFVLSWRIVVCLWVCLILNVLVGYCVFVDW